MIGSDAAFCNTLGSHMKYFAILVKSWILYAFYFTEPIIVKSRKKDNLEINRSITLTNSIN